MRGADPRRRSAVDDAWPALRRPQPPDPGPAPIVPRRAAPASGFRRSTLTGRAAASPAAAPSRRMLQYNGDLRTVPPQPVKSIEVAFVLMLDVHDDVDIVEQGPPPRAGSLAAGGLVSGASHLLFDLVDDRVHLPLVGRRRDHEDVGDHQLF